MALIYYYFLFSPKKLRGPEGGPGFVYTRQRSADTCRDIKDTSELEFGSSRIYLALINQAGGLYGRILTEVVSTD